MSNLKIEFMSLKLNAEVVCELLNDYKVETLNRIQLVLQYKNKEIKMDQMDGLKLQVEYNFSG